MALGAKQADAGRAAYTANCGRAITLLVLIWGGAAIAAAQAASSPVFTAKELLDYMSGAMPFGGPSLDADTYLALTAYILQANVAAAVNSRTHRQSGVYGRRE
jgi:hypothetical protein